MLQQVTGYPDLYLACAHSNIEQELYLPRIMDGWGRGTVTQQHFKANSHNLDLLELFEIKPVLLVRNVLDILVSMREHVLQAKPNNLPGLYPPVTFPSLREEEQFDFLVDFAAPWLISLYASWDRAIQEGRSEILVVRYEDAKRDWILMGARILEFNGIEMTKDRLSQVVNRLESEPAANVRRNVGIVGRGSEKLSRKQRERVAEIASRYPDVDFSPVGL